MQLANNVRRWWRRITVAGVDTIFDYEIASIQAILQNVLPEHRLKIAHQFDRYDRVDRAPNRRKQRFVDDDSDFHRSRWPREILFPIGDTELVATLKLRHKKQHKAAVRAKAFLVFGWFDGFKFDFDNTRGLDFDIFQMSEVTSSIEKIETNWEPIMVELTGLLRK